MAMEAVGAIGFETDKKKPQVTGEVFDFPAFIQRTSVFEAAQLWQKPQETTGATAMYG